MNMELLELLLTASIVFISVILAVFYSPYWLIMIVLRHYQLHRGSKSLL